MSKEYSGFVYDVNVSYFEDVDEVMKTMQAVDEEMRQDPAFSADILAPLEIFGLDRFEDSSVVIRAPTKTRPLQQWRVAREFNRRLKKAFESRQIRMPFPHITLFVGQDKAGQAAPLRIHLEDK